jgi:hypothetical protein
MDSNEKSLRCSCANGHKIRANRKHAGRTIACPACGVSVTLPQPAAASISDTGAVRILNDLESQFQETQKQQPTRTPSRIEKVAKPQRTCPRCNCEISKTDHVCPECKVILATGSRGFQRAYLAALRSLK